MPKAEWGVKRTCPNCEARFYDLQREPIVCPECGAAFAIDTHGKVSAARDRRAPVPIADDEAALVEDETLEDAEEDEEEPLLADDDEGDDAGPVLAEENDEEEEAPAFKDAGIIDEDEIDEDEEDDEAGESIEELDDIPDDDHRQGT